MRNHWGRVKCEARTAASLGMQAPEKTKAKFVRIIAEQRRVREKLRMQKAFCAKASGWNGNLYHLIPKSPVLGIIKTGPTHRRKNNEKRRKIHGKKPNLGAHVGREGGFKVRRGKQIEPKGKSRHRRHNTEHTKQTRTSKIQQTRLQPPAASGFHWMARSWLKPRTPFY